MQWRVYGLVTFFAASSIIGLPGGCEEQANFEEIFGYLTQREDYRPPEQGHVTVYQTNGPVAGGSVQALAAAPDGALYAGFFGDGIYRSRDGGEHWEPAKSGLGDSFIISLLAHDDGTLLAGTVRKGLYRSEDGGQSWRESNEGLTNSQVASLAMDRKKRIIAGTGGGVFLSRDGGRHWTAANVGLELTLVRSIATSPSGDIFIGTAGKGVLRSQDGGKTWDAINSGLMDQAGLRENFIRTLTLGGDGTLYAGSFGGGVFRTMDQGQTWQAITASLPNQSIRSVAIGRDGKLLVGTGEGVFSSTNRGARWNTLSEAMPDTNVQTLLVSLKGDLYVGTGSGLLKQSRGSTAWQVLDQGLLFPRIRALTFDPSRGIFAGTHGSGVFRSRDGGSLWEPMSEGLPNSDVRFLVQDAEHTLYAGTERGVYRGDRQARRWVPLDEGLGDREITALVLAAEGHLYAGTPQGLFYRSIREFLTEETAPQAGWLSIELARPEPSAPGSPAKIQSISVAPGGAVYAATETRIYKQPGRNRAWEPLPMKPSPGRIEGIAVSDAVYLWTSSAIFKGEESGQRTIEWKSLSAGMPDGTGVRMLRVSEGKRGAMLYAGTDRGLFWIQEGGEKWNRAQGPLADAPVETILSPAEGVLILGSQKHGVLFGADLVRPRGIFGLL